MLEDFFNEIVNDLKEDANTFKSFTKKDWLETAGDILAISGIIAGVCVIFIAVLALLN